MTRKITFSIWETDAPIPDSKWAACFDEYDLDDPVGTGPTAEDAIIDLLQMHDIKFSR
jgi:hypothetical protein